MITMLEKAEFDRGIEKVTEGDFSLKFYCPKCITADGTTLINEEQHDDWALLNASSTLE
jgi:hypothetical protein